LGLFGAKYETKFGPFQTKYRPRPKHAAASGQQLLAYEACAEPLSSFAQTLRAWTRLELATCAAAMGGKFVG